MRYFSLETPVKEFNNAITRILTKNRVMPVWVLWLLFLVPVIVATVFTIYIMIGSHITYKVMLEWCAVVLLTACNMWILTNKRGAI